VTQIYSDVDASPDVATARRVRPAETQYTTDVNLWARQRLWQISPRQPSFSLYSWVVGLARLRGDEAILEVGCGNGAYLELIQAVGLDASVGMLAAARARTANPLVAGDVTRLPFAAASFDVVLAAHMLYHVEDRVGGVRELRRVLAPGGVCIAVTNGEHNHAEMVALVEQVVGHGWRWRRPSDVAFSLENGAEQLRVAFEQVDLVRCPDGVVLVKDADALADYLRSVGDHYQDEIAGWMDWEDLVTECQCRVVARIDAEGAFPISASIGAFICR
jgi:SAM-dependent methyltransferase